MESLTENKKSVSVKAADNIRILSAAMVEKAKSGHPGGPMGGADFMHAFLFGCGAYVSHVVCYTDLARQL